MRYSLHRAVVETLDDRRLLAFGMLDPSFGTGGVVETSFRSFNDALGITTQSDGKIIVVGDTAESGSDKDGFVARYNVNGTLDTTFGTGGRTIFSFLPGDDDLPMGVGVQSDGKIVVGGTTGSDQDVDFFVKRFDMNGLLDLSYNGTGTRRIDFGGVDFGRRLIVDSQDRAVLVGSSLSLSGGGAAFARLTTGGLLDTTFSGDGLFTSGTGNFSSADTATSIVEDGMGRYVIGGARISGNVFSQAFTSSDPLLMRINTNGTLDSTFDGDGRATPSLGASDLGYSFITGVALDPVTGNIVAGGTTGDGLFDFGETLPDGTSSTLNIAKGFTMRLLAGGVLDFLYSQDGLALYEVLNKRVGVTDVHVQGDQTIGVTGAVQEAGGEADFFIARSSILGDPIDSTPFTTIPRNGSSGAFAGMIDGFGRYLLAGHDKLGGIGQMSILRLLGDDVYLNPRDGWLALNGSDASDTATITSDGITTGINFNGMGYSYLQSRINGVYGNMGNGDNFYSMPVGLVKPSRVVGGTGSDTFRGGGGPDTLLGNDGADSLMGNFGPDSILGGFGRDTLGGGKGHDYMGAGKGLDMLVGGLGRDTMIGGLGNDTISAADGFADSIDGGDGIDLVMSDNLLDILLRVP